MSWYDDRAYMYLIKNGELQPDNESLVSVYDRAFLYGDGFFSTIKVRAGHVQLWERHLARLQECAERLFFQVHFDALPHYMSVLLNHFSAEVSTQSGIIKVVVSRGEGPRGYLPPEQPADVYVQFFPQTGTEKPATAIESGILVRRLGLTMPLLRGLKTLNRIEQVVMRRELAQRGWQEGLVFDVNGELVEGVSSNCFLYINGMWHTPDLRSAGVKGVMRAEILACMQAQGIPHYVGQLTQADVSQANAIFFCNALTDIVAVKSIDERVLNTESVQQLRQQLLLPFPPI